jgi:serine/threonine protein kinase
MFRKPHLIPGKDLNDQLVQTLRMCDSEPVLDFIERKQLLINPKMHFLFDEMKENKFSWESLINNFNENTFDAQGLDLMKKMLHVDPEQRISVQECLQHPFLKL